MLIFTRKPGERFIINDDIVVTVLDYKGKQVRIGVDAPQNVKIYREEIYQKINAEELDSNNKG